MTTQRQLLEPIRLEFSNNSVRRTTAQVDSLGIFYSVSREDDGIINVRRWDQPTNTEILVGQINFKWFTPSLVRVGEGTQWVNIRDFLRREHGRWYSPFVSSLPITISYFLVPDASSSARTFTGSNGTDYRWCMPWTKLMVGRFPTPEDDSNLTWRPALPG